MNPLAIVTFFTTGWMRWVVLGVVVAAAALWYREHLINVGRAEVIAENKVQRAVYVEKIVHLKGATLIRYVEAKAKTEGNATDVAKEVPNVPSRSACNATAGWVRVHDAAAENRRVTGAVDEATDSGVGEAAVAGVVTRNYFKFHQVVDDLTACRAFVDGLSKITP